MSDVFFASAKPPLSEHAQWSRGVFDGMTNGKRWGVPRSGLLFQREGDALVLIARMPHDPGMPCSAAELHAAQQADVNIIKRYFGEAGITVIDRTPEGLREETK